MKVQEVIDRVLERSCGGRKLEETCDVLASGSPGVEVTGIVTTFTARRRDQGGDQDWRDPDRHA
ncbi:hypothetical protein J19TS2_51090 [Cohnella xylanilytica]|uniref:hypothetical protein n=1 Tax=Cohnella xylanilytica TaxID=557555 RepID=UPI001B1E975A|nr:hypothetical protein [Cohnella xylanilytica]GIO15554.1 hypothetical protein J19TS2_51090 [Cohnella xylanilytica]